MLIEVNYNKILTDVLIQFKMKVLFQECEPQYLLVGPGVVCGDTQLTVVPLTGVLTRYNWSISVAEVRAMDLWHRQRLNLLVWLGTRQILKPTQLANLDKLFVNSSLVI